MMIKNEFKNTADGEWIASFTFDHDFSAEHVWNVLTNQHLVNQWYPELRMHAVRKSGNVIFDFGDDKIHELPIKEFEDGHLLGFEWYGSYIRFEVATDGALQMTFEVNEINEQSLRDLTGWTMISKTIDATLHGEQFTFEKEEAKKIRAEYERELGI